MGCAGCLVKTFKQFIARRHRRFRQFVEVGTGRILLVALEGEPYHRLVGIEVLFEVLEEFELLIIFEFVVVIEKLAAVTIPDTSPTVPMSLSSSSAIDASSLPVKNKLRWRLTSPKRKSWNLPKATT